MSQKTRKCSFCGEEIPPGTGIALVRNDGTTLWFCSSKCRKSAIKLKRNPTRLRWTKVYRPPT